MSTILDYEDIVAAYDTNATYDIDNDATKAGAFIVACRRLLRFFKRAAHGGRGAEEFELSPEVIQQEKQSAETWLAQKNRASNVGTHYASFEDFRE